MKKILILVVLLHSLLVSQELKIEAASFSADELKGISIFKGNVSMVKHHDVLKASEVTLYINKEKQPTKFVATGNVSFKIETKSQAKYEGRATKVVYLVEEKEYHFYKNVNLKQLDEKKEIQGDEVVLNINSGKAYAQGLNKGPVIMIFDIKEEE